MAVSNAWEQMSCILYFTLLSPISGFLFGTHFFTHWKIAYHNFKYGSYILYNCTSALTMQSIKILKCVSTVFWLVDAFVFSMHSKNSSLERSKSWLSISTTWHIRFQRFTFHLQAHKIQMWNLKISKKKFLWWRIFFTSFVKFSLFCCFYCSIKEAAFFFFLFTRTFLWIANGI